MAIIGPPLRIVLNTGRAPSASALEAHDIGRFLTFAKPGGDATWRRRAAEGLGLTRDRCVHSVDQGPVPRVLPPWPHLVHHVSERNPSVRVGKAERSPYAEVAERA